MLDHRVTYLPPVQKGLPVTLCYLDQGIPSLSTMGMSAAERMGLSMETGDNSFEYTTICGHNIPFVKPVYILVK